MEHLPPKEHNDAGGGGADARRRAGRTGLVTALACAGMLACFAALAWCSVRLHSPTIDEPLHAAGAYFHSFYHDFRINPEDPPLWKYWAMLPHRRDSLRPHPDSTYWDLALGDIYYQFAVAIRWLFQTPGNDGAAFINTSQAMMLMVGVALGVVLGVWSWQLGGATAAIVAVALFSFDPNFIAHAPLVKNDVSLSLAMLCVAWVCWSVGRRAAWWNVLLLAGLCGVAAGVKFSGVIVGPLVLLMLLARARLVPDCWPVFGRELRGRSARVLAALAVCVVAMAVGAAVLWAAYGFRFRPTPVAGAVLDTQAQVRKLKECRFFLANQRWPNQADEAVIDAMPTPVFARAVLFAQRHRLLPQTWLYGLLFTYRSTLVRTTYLLGQHSETGWWYYFPLAMLFKTPLATLAAMVGAVVLKLGWRLRRSNSSPKISRFTPDRWSALCLTIPLIVYGASALTSNLNLGLRHVLPVYPFIYVLVGLTAAKMVAWRPGAASLVALVLGMGLIIETVRAFPHYISFFNVPSRPHRLWLLSDSNFDWGQDLTFIAQWRRRHPHVKLYLGYLGSVDPAFYGIDYTNIPGGYQLNPQWEWPPREPGVVAISATVLQGVNVPPSVIRLYAPLRARQPEQMIGDTIYVYDWPLR